MKNQIEQIKQFISKHVLPLWKCAEVISIYDNYKTLTFENGDIKIKVSVMVPVCQTSYSISERGDIDYTALSHDVEVDEYTIYFNGDEFYSHEHYELFQELIQQKLNNNE